MKGLAWSVKLLDEVRPRPYAVVGCTVYGCPPGKEWASAKYDGNKQCDIAVLSALGVQESRGAVLDRGPVEFGVPDDFLDYRWSDDISDYVWVTPQEVGRLAEQALGFDRPVPLTRAGMPVPTKTGTLKSVSWIPSVPPLAYEPTGMTWTTTHRSPRPGDVHYDTEAREVKAWNGVEWVTISSAPPLKPLSLGPKEKKLSLKPPEELL